MPQLSHHTVDIYYLLWPPRLPVLMPCLNYSTYSSESGHVIPNINKTRDEYRATELVFLVVQQYRGYVMCMEAIRAGTEYRFYHHWMRLISYPLTVAFLAQMQPPYLNLTPTYPHQHANQNRSFAAKFTVRHDLSLQPSGSLIKLICRFKSLNPNLAKNEPKNINSSEAICINIQ